MVHKTLRQARSDPGQQRPSHGARSGKALAALALLVALQGCVAAVAAIAVPAATGVGIRQKNEAERETRESARGSAIADAVPGGLALPGPAAPASAPDSSAADPVLEITELTELPAPSFAMGPAPAMASAPAGWQGFFDYALAAASRRANGIPANSAILTPVSAANAMHQVEACSDGDSAVLLDLDQGGEATASNAAMQPVPGLAEGLADLRANGIVVMWISRLGADHVSLVADSLRNSGLDPDGRDPILLAFQPEDRKQVIRESAGESVCVLAIAGDRMGDFHELFDYLRNPLDARYFNDLVGAGWFLVPPPFAGQSGAASGAFMPEGQTSGQRSP